MCTYNISEKPYFILPLKKRICEVNLQDIKILCIIHLHYLDTIENYFKYIDEIPIEIDIIFTTSATQIEEKINEHFRYLKRNYKIIKKENRGRDISALLVACKSIILNYEYVCFIHDKKEKSILDKEDTKIWIKSLWDNILGSKELIYNILTSFQEDKKLGLLVPPICLSPNYTIAYTNTWTNNFKNTIRLAERMNLKCTLDEKIPPLSLGTVFWGRTSALRKIFLMEWDYSDFDEEPLKIDGTISHAIERIFSFVVQDAGYYTKVVMNDQYACYRMNIMDMALGQVLERLQKSLGIKTISQLEEYNNDQNKLLNFSKGYSVLYVYGAGVIGKRCYEILSDIKIYPVAFLVSEIDNEEREYQHIPVRKISKEMLVENCGIIVAVSEKYKEEIKQMIRSYHFDMSNVLFMR